MGSKRLAISAAAIVAIVALAWTGGWFWLATWAERNVSPLLAKIAEEGMEVDCSGYHVVGFPFALRLACAEATIADRESGTEATFPALTGGASVFRPMTAEIALAAPAHMESPLFDGAAEIAWDAAEVDVDIGLSGPRGFSFDTTALTAEFSLADLSDPRVIAVRAAGMVQPTSDGGTEAAVSFTDLAISADGTKFPPVSGAGSVLISVPPRALLSGRANLQAPLWARDIDIELTGGGVTVTADGEITVDAEGVVDGALTLRIAGADAIPAWIATLPPERQPIGSAAAGALFVFGRPTTIEGQPASEIRIEIERGVARIGSEEIPLPRVPL